MDKFVGLGVFIDTYPNEEKQQEVMARARVRTAVLMSQSFPSGAVYKRGRERQ